MAFKVPVEEVGVKVEVEAGTTTPTSRHCPKYLRSLQVPRKPAFVLFCFYFSVFLGLVDDSPQRYTRFGGATLPPPPLYFWVFLLVSSVTVIVPFLMPASQYTLPLLNTRWHPPRSFARLVSFWPIVQML
jgi:hypothetical protein